MQNRPSLLVETHSLKAARTRAWANYDIMRHAIDTILLDPEGLRRAVREADREMAARAGNRSAPRRFIWPAKSATRAARWCITRSKPRRTRAKSPARTSPATPAEPDDLDTRIHDQIDTTVEAQMPLGYLIPAAWKQVADLLALHGVEMERTAKPLEQEFETYRFTGTKFAAGAMEGHVSRELRAAPGQGEDLHSRRLLLGADEAAPRAPDPRPCWSRRRPIRWPVGPAEFRLRGGGGAGPEAWANISPSPSPAA